MHNFKGANIHDRVWSYLHGWGEIINVIIDEGIPYPVQVEFEDCGTEDFTLDGRLLSDDKNPTLFWEEMVLMPKYKMEKIERWVNVYPDNTIGSMWDTEEQALDAANHGATTIKLSGEYKKEIKYGY